LSAPQRSYTASCSFCGAPVEFRSAASAFAVCSYCRSTLVRDGEHLRRIGESAELFDDHSPLQLGASGRYLGEAFTLVGRLQYGYADGTWNEWHALFDSGRSGWLSEDNGRYVFAFDGPLSGEVPQASELHAGDKRLVDGRIWDVASVTRARLIAAQGELPRPPKLQGEFIVSDLRNAQGEVGTLDYAEPAKPQWSSGRSVALSELAMSGLKGDSEKTLSARGLGCPSCGASLEVKLASTKSIVCRQCHAVIDVSQGVGGALQHYAQEQGAIEPLIPLGSTGKFIFGGREALPWQVVGYVERCEIPEDPDDEQVFWREYLLYHRSEGFAFIVDAQDGWSWVKTITGVPSREGADGVRHEGVSYRKLYSYTGQITYVLGEFYWRLQRGQRTFNTDYKGTGARSDRRLNREQAGAEVVWSAGATLTDEAVRQAFALPATQAAAMRRDVKPVSSGGLGSLLRSGLWVVLVLLLIFGLIRCSRDDCDELRATFGEASNEYQQCLRSNQGGGGYGYRSSGGSFGGFSSGGGGHK
jgi:uncharacterized membrane protein YgcG